MVESGLNVRSEVRNSYNMKLVVSRYNTDDYHDENDDDGDIDILRDIDLHSVRHLFVLISMSYCLTVILEILTIIHYLLYKRSSIL